MKRVFIYFCSMGLTGCHLDFLRDNPNNLPTQDPILSDGISQSQTPYSGPSLYCYKTLADVDCHTSPLKNNSKRLVGQYNNPTEIEVIEIQHVPGAKD